MGKLRVAKGKLGLPATSPHPKPWGLGWGEVGVLVGVRVTGRLEDLRTQTRLNSHKLATGLISKAFRYEDKVRNQ